MTTTPSCPRRWAPSTTSASSRSWTRTYWSPAAPCCSTTRSGCAWAAPPQSAPSRGAAAGALLRAPRGQGGSRGPSGSGSGRRLPAFSQVHAVIGVLMDDTDPLVTVMKVEKAPQETYADIGGLDNQIQEIKVRLQPLWVRPALLSATPWRALAAAAPVFFTPVLGCVGPSLLCQGFL